MPSTGTSAIRFAGLELLLDSAGALYWPHGEWLVVSDLHLEKASFLAQFGSLLPRYDTRATLQALSGLIQRYQPKQLVCLGDSFHDRHSYARLEAADRASLLALVQQVPHWHWVLGNHDPALSDELPGHQHARLDMGGIHLMHEPEDDNLPQIVGHFHPKRRVALGGHGVSGKVFIHDERRLLMPAFGSYTGGLDAFHDTIRALVSEPAHYLLYRGRIWKL